MKILSYDLRSTPTQHGYMPKLSVYLLDEWKQCSRPLVIVVPGGGYSCVCKDREGERIALQYNAAGFHAAVLEYAVKPHTHPEPIRNLARAICLVREHALEWQVNPENIAVCGFSAGGHLCGSISTLWNDPSIFTEEEITGRKHRPNASILSYPVISAGESGHLGSFKNLLGITEVSPEIVGNLSLETSVNEGTCPSFIWHTFRDQIVPVNNSLLYAQALERQGIPFELHIYPNGAHGLAVQSDEVYWSKPDRERNYHWIPMSIDWLNELFETSKK